MFFFRVGIAILSYLPRLPGGWRLVLRHILYQLGDGNAEYPRYFIERVQRRIVLGIVPDGLDRFEIDIGGPMESSLSKAPGLRNLFHPQASHIYLPLVG